MVDAQGRPFWGVFGSCLTALAPGRDARELLDQYVALGLTGVRVFAGALTWAGQTPEGARAALPDFLEQTRQRGLYTEVTINTDTGTGYDVPRHTAAVGAILAACDHTIGEIANEHWHPTQASAVHSPAYLLAMRQLIPATVPCALSAAEDDERPSPTQAYPTAGGDLITVHLQRGLEPWFKEACRVREQADISEWHGVPVINNEPTKTRHDPAFHFLLGLCARGFNLPVTVFHSESGLQARPLSGDEQACAHDLVRGYTALAGDAPFSYRGSHYPVADAAWYEPDQGARCWRAYGFTRAPADGPSYVVFSGLPATDYRDADARWTDGWVPLAVEAVADQTSLVRIGR